MLKFCAFDLDGTLVDTLADIHGSLNFALTTNGFAPVAFEQIPRLIGRSVAWMCQKALPPEQSDAHWEEVFKSFNEHYRFHCCDLSSVYPGIPELLARLKAAGVTLAVVSNKPHRECVTVMKTLFPNDCFNLVLGRFEKFALKPDPEPLLFAMNYFGVSREEAVYVGDSEVDLQFAKNAGLRCVSVGWGTRSKQELLSSGAIAVADTADEAAELILI